MMINALPNPSDGEKFYFIWFSNDKGKSWVMDSDATAPLNNVHQAMNVAGIRCDGRKWQIRDGDGKFVAGFQIFGE